MITRRHGYLAYRSDAAPAASKALESTGYCVLPGVFSATETAELVADIHRVFEAYPPDQRSSVRPPAAAEMFRYEMLNRSSLCHQAIAHRGILDVLEPLLGEDCHVIANTAWRNPPDSTGQHGGDRWHIDAGPHIPLAPGITWPDDIPHPVFAVGCHIYLQSCGLADGPTGVIPGSHLSGCTPPADRLLDDALQYQGRGVEPLLAEPGDVGLFVSDVWHRRMPTAPGDQGRFFLQVHYGRRDIAQRLRTTDQSNQLSASAISKATETRSRQLIGLHQPLFYDG
ncbi:MAG: phytanoyl-CoA dioxygenase family protein [Pseudomonadota bacterium]